MSLTSINLQKFILPKNNKHIKKTDFVGSAYFNVIVMYC